MNYLLAALSIAILIGHSAPAQAADCFVEGAKELQTRVHEHTASEQTIMELEREACRLFKARDLDRAMDIMVAERGILLLDGAGVAQGREAQRALFKGFFAAGFDIVFEPVDARVSASDDMAWAVGMIKLTKPDGSVDLGKYVSVWEKIDDEWKNVIEMRNSNNGSTISGF